MLTESKRISLFCSFPSLIRLVINNEVSSEELGYALFAFDCTRYHVFDDVDNEATWFDNPEEALQIVRSAVLQAEKENRIVWRNPMKERNMSYDKIQTLLYDQDLNPLGFSKGWGYNYSELKRRVEVTNPGVWVRY